jgi:hypothetical protein
MWPGAIAKAKELAEERTVAVAAADVGVPDPSRCGADSR